MFYSKSCKARLSFKSLACFILITFTLSSTNIQLATAQTYPTPGVGLGLPQPGVMVEPSPFFTPTLLKGLKVNFDDAFQFDFIIEPGDQELTQNDLKAETNKLIKYFLTSLTVPQNDIWVNLSPYEKNRIMANNLSFTQMGKELLAQDYLLKQLSSSLLYPEDDLGKRFWSKIYSKAYAKLGTTDIPMDAFNKVWIVPEKAVIFENNGVAIIKENRLKVMMQQDYVAMDNQRAIAESRAPARDIAMQQNQLGEEYLVKSEEQKKQTPFTLHSSLFTEVIIPELEREVNEGKHFAPLRQIFNSLVLAVWYKKALHTSILTKSYADQNKLKGVDVDDPGSKEKIYEQYLQAYRKGVFNYIKEDYDPSAKQVVPRKYFSGGVGMADFAVLTTSNPSGINLDTAMVANARVTTPSERTRILFESKPTEGEQQPSQSPQELLKKRGHPSIFTNLKDAKKPTKKYPLFEAPPKTDLPSHNHETADTTANEEQITDETSDEPKAKLLRARRIRERKQLSVEELWTGAMDIQYRKLVARHHHDELVALGIEEPIQLAEKLATFKEFDNLEDEEKLQIKTLKEFTDERKKILEGLNVESLSFFETTDTYLAWLQNAENHGLALMQLFSFFLKYSEYANDKQATVFTPEGKKQKALMNAVYLLYQELNPMHHFFSEIIDNPLFVTSNLSSHKTNDSHKIRMSVAKIRKKLRKGETSLIYSYEFKKRKSSYITQTATSDEDMLNKLQERKILDWVKSWGPTLRNAKETIKKGLTAPLTIFPKLIESRRKIGYAMITIILLSIVLKSHNAPMQINPEILKLDPAHEIVLDESQMPEAFTKAQTLVLNDFFFSDTDNDGLDGANDTLDDSPRDSNDYLTAADSPTPTETPIPTETATPTETPEPTKTTTPAPSDTPTIEPTETPEPTKTQTPEPIETKAPEPKQTPEATPSTADNTTDTPDLETKQDGDKSDSKNESKKTFTKHIVQGGENLWTIADADFNLWEKIQEVNNLDNPDHIYPGQELIIPLLDNIQTIANNATQDAGSAGGDGGGEGGNGEGEENIEQEQRNIAINQSIDNQSSGSTTETSNQTKTEQETTYTVEDGDSLGWIATQYDNVSVQNLIDANPHLKDNPSHIKIGENLKIPTSQSSTSQIAQEDKDENKSAQKEITKEALENLMVDAIEMVVGENPDQKTFALHVGDNKNLFKKVMLTTKSHVTVESNWDWSFVGKDGDSGILQLMEDAWNDNNKRLVKKSIIPAPWSFTPENTLDPWKNFIVGVEHILFIYERNSKKFPNMPNEKAFVHNALTYKRGQNNPVIASGSIPQDKPAVQYAKKFADEYFKGGLEMFEKDPNKTMLTSVIEMFLKSTTVIYDDPNLKEYVTTVLETQERNPNLDALIQAGLSLLGPNPHLRLSEDSAARIAQPNFNSDKHQLFHFKSEHKTIYDLVANHHPELSEKQRFLKTQEIVRLNEQVFPRFDPRRLKNDDFIVLPKELSKKIASANTGDKALFTKGGIDLNEKYLDLQIEKNGLNIPIPIHYQNIENIKIDGLEPFIINITPITDVPFLLGNFSNKKQKDPLS